MPKYAILRDFPPELTREQIDGNVFALLIAQRLYNTYCRHLGLPAPDTSLDSVRDMAEDAPFSFDPSDGDGVQWIRSYWAEGTSWGTCLFDASSQIALRHFQTTCDQDGGVETNEILEVASKRFVDEDGSTLPLPRDWELVSLYLPLDQMDLTDTECLAEAMEYAAKAPPLNSEVAAHWIRAYSDPQQGRALGIFGVPAETAAALSASPDVEAYRVVEITPSAYLE